jgi:two-component system, OmpR family, sensor histidine kinase ArlS
MKITTKINLLTTLWMVCILVIINVIVYFLFMTTTINMEKNMLYKKSDNIISELNSTVPSNMEPILGKFLTENSFIRIIEPENKVVYEVTNDPKLSKKINESYTKTKSSKTRVIAGESGEEQVLITHVPIKINGTTGSLEVAERLQGLEMRKEILRVILIIGTILAAILSLFGGRWLANIIMKPISNIIHTMSDIEKSGVPKKINIQNDTKDELQTMIVTFNQMIDRLEENIEKQKQFVSDASHEFKTPLTVIKTYVGVLKRQGFENKDVANEAIQAIDLETKRIQKMTENFLDLATIENHKELELSELNLCSIFRDILKQMKIVYRREIDLVLKESTIIIKADELKIKQVIFILLDNAIKYSSGRIECLLKQDENHAFISIKDYGIGIPRAELKNIFERFYRVDKARSRETGGTGLGLHIARSIVKLHKGDIAITSQEGVGTTVKITLPFE